MNNQRGRVLGLDYGAKTVGVAVSDPLRLTAQSLEIIRRKDETHLRATMRRIQEIIAEYGVTEIVLGLPLNMDDSVGERARRTIDFQKALAAKTGLPVRLSDERLTSVEAEEAMKLAGVKEREQKKYVDRVAAAIILQDWLNAHAQEADEAGS